MSGWQDFYRFLSEAGLSPDSLYDSLEQASIAFAGNLITLSPGLLGACLAIRIIAGVVLEMIDGDLVDVIKKVFFGLLMGGILGVILSTWQSGETYSIRTLTDDTLNALSGIAPGSASPGDLGGVIEPFFTSIGSTIDTSFRALIVLQDEIFSPGRVARDTISSVIAGDASYLLPFLANAGYLVIAWASFLISSLAMIALLVAVVFFSMTGLFMIQLALAFGPFTIAVYPLVNDWAKRILSTLIGGIFQFVAGLLLLGILNTTVGRFVTYVENVMRVNIL